jgi:hypothetical protein
MTLDEIVVEKKVLKEGTAPRATSPMAKSSNKGKQKTTKRAKARRVTFQWSGG